MDEVYKWPFVDRLCLYNIHFHQYAKSDGGREKEAGSKLGRSCTLRTVLYFYTQTGINETYLEKLDLPHHTKTRNVES